MLTVGDWAIAPDVGRSHELESKKKIPSADCEYSSAAVTMGWVLQSLLPSLWERLKPHCRIQARQGSADTLLKILRALPVDTRASNVVYWALLSVYGQ